MSEGFPIFLDHCHTHFSQGIVDSKWWTTIENGRYTPCSASEGRIRSPIHRFIHRLITFSINQKKEGGVFLGSMYYFYGVSSHQIHFTTYLIAWKIFLQAELGKTRNGSYLWRNLVTKLVCYYVIFDAPEENCLTVIHSCLLQPQLFKTACILMDLGVETTWCPMMIRLKHHMHSGM